MIRELFHIGSLSISPFGVMMALSFAASYLLLRWGLRKLGIGDDDDASAIVIAGAVAGIVGAKIYYVVLYRDWRLLYDRSGFVWYGGFVLAAVAIVWTLRRRRLPVWPTLDAASAALALGYAIGRLGCFLVGDDYGVPTDRPWGVRFPYGLPPTTAGALRSPPFNVDVPPDVPDGQLLAVHPTQLYETALALAICALGIWLLKRRTSPGTTALVVIGLLSVERFAIEFLRAKDDRFFGGLTVAQLISVVVVLVVASLWVMRHRRAAPAAA
jgi:phosphatidylglycerol---prolipoprotein diacylglyceryl transferase